MIFLAGASLFLSLITGVFLTLIFLPPHNGKQPASCSGSLSAAVLDWRHLLHLFRLSPDRAYALHGSH